MTDTTDAPEYYDLHIRGLGYLYRYREIKPRKGERFFAVDISALHGEKNEVTYIRFDCKIVGSDALQHMQTLKPHLDAEKRVLVGFKLSDLTPETFVYNQGHPKAGQTGVSLKARLLKIDWAKVNGEWAIRPLVRDEQSAQQQAA